MKTNRKVLAAGLVVTAPLIVLLLVGLGRNPHAVRSPLVGRPAPPFTLTPVGGGAPISLESLKGRAVVLNFWATWCVPCAEEHDVLVAGSRAWADQASFLGVVYQDEESDVRDFLKKHGRAYPSLFDEGGKTAIAYGVFGVPETFFIAPDGTIVEKYAGPLRTEELSGYLRMALRHGR